MKRILRWVFVGVLALAIALFGVVRYSTWDLIYEKSDLQGERVTLEGHPGEVVVEIGYSRLASKMFADGVDEKTGASCYWNTMDGICYVISQRGAERIRRNGSHLEISGDVGSPEVLVSLK